MATAASSMSRYKGESQSAFYRPELDTLRFFAFLAVFAYHAFPNVSSVYEKLGAPKFLAQAVADCADSARFGVDLFFLLSAFLLTELLLREREKAGSVDVRFFYIRRALRIWPLYFLAIVLAYLVPIFDPSQAVSWRYAFWYVFMLGNWSYLLTGFGYTTSLMLSPLWSVSLEEQFYLIWPNVVRSRLSEAGLARVACLLLVLNTLACLEISIYKRGWNLWLNSFTRMDSIAAGILLCLASRKYKFNLSSTALRPAAILAGIAIWALVAANWKLHEAVSVPGALVGYPLIALGSSLIFVGFWGTTQQAPVLIYLGKISYGLYVFHLLVMHFVFRALGDATKHLSGFLLYTATALTGTFILSMASYQLFEAPFLRLKERFTYVSSRPV